MMTLLSNPREIENPSSPPSASDRKRRRVSPTSPTNHAVTSGHALAAHHLSMPSNPSAFSGLATAALKEQLSIEVPRRRTESFDFDHGYNHSDLPTGNKVIIPPRSHSNTDEHCIEHSSSNKAQRPPFADSTMESATFATFTAPDTSTFGTSSSFIGLAGLFDVDDGDGNDSSPPANQSRRSSAVGLDLMDGRQAETDTSMETLSHPLAVPAIEKCPSVLNMPQLQRWKERPTTCDQVLIKRCKHY